MHHFRTAFSRRLGVVLLGISLLPLVVPARLAAEGDAFAEWLGAQVVASADVAALDAAAFDAALGQASASDAASLGAFLSVFAEAYVDEGGSELGLFFGRSDASQTSLSEHLLSLSAQATWRAIFPRPLALTASAGGAAGVGPTPGASTLAAVAAPSRFVLLRAETHRAAPTLLRLVYPVRLFSDASPLGP